MTAIEPMRVVVANRDFTERFASREGDLLVWLRAPGLMQRGHDFEVADFWYLRDGEHLLVSNRLVDFPAWFTLHPTEASGTEVFRMMERLRAGWEQGDPVDGPNVWRVGAGDRIVWVGHRDTVRHGVLAIVDCRECVLVAGEGRHTNIDDWMAFGDLPSEGPTEEQRLLVQAGVQAAISLGGPRTVSDGWRIG